jgi:hypothetical protein
MAKFILRTLYFFDIPNLFCTEAEKSSLVRPQGFFCSVEYV